VSVAAASIIVCFAKDILAQLKRIVVHLLTLALAMLVPILLLLESKWRVCKKVFKDAL
jgi:hypothetical protein